MMEKQIAQQRKSEHQNRSAMDKVETQLHSVESKWINNQLSFDSYTRWFQELTTQKLALKAQLEGLSRDDNETYRLLQKELYKLTDLHLLYNSATILQKQQLVKLGFDQQLYFREGLSNLVRASALLSQ